MEIRVLFPVAPSSFFLYCIFLLSTFAYTTTHAFFLPASTLPRHIPWGSHYIAHTTLNIDVFTWQRRVSMSPTLQQAVATPIASPDESPDSPPDTPPGSPVDASPDPPSSTKGPTTKGTANTERVRTENGGFSHTPASRAKISAANKGKIPWNKGKSHTEELKAKIRAGVLARLRDRFVLKLQKEGITEQEYHERKQEEERKKQQTKMERRTKRGGLLHSQETKAKLSQMKKEQYAKGLLSGAIGSFVGNRNGKAHTDATRQKISASLKARWKDKTYRKRWEQARERLSDHRSKKMKELWTDPEYRSKMINSFKSRKKPGKLPEERRQKIAESVRQKWQDPDFREKVLGSIARTRPRKDPSELKPPKERKKKSPRPPKVTKETRDQARAALGETLHNGPRHYSDPFPFEADENSDSDIADGNLRKLKNYRPDLYELLYGDSEQALEYMAQLAMTENPYKMLDEGDLELFDPYNLEREPTDEPKNIVD
eukprot:Nitzschia sp. Nitz4//scaffold328_size19456//9639//11099//NITZ4_008721-RA/size19456-processed-gene-0.10-mRNA-1//1//CDS//3329547974//5023//frame0